MPSSVLLAPVPRDHIAAAREVALANGGQVAFGSGTNKVGRMWEFFQSRVKPGMEVLIYVSSTGSGEYYGHVFSHRAKYVRVVASENEVAHLRPTTALANDTPHGCYWVVEDFQKLDEAEFVSFKEFGLKESLRGPRIK